ncbi:hypothetical protein BDZ89DRAFT_1066525 [Hymenopellis radicata]|nr:hypothetical protein BDZ89DRAFT_1066525 [Hymenopellis radicata]
MCLTHPIHDLPLELKLVIIDCVSLHFPSLKALFQSRLWHRDCGVYIQKQVFRNITLAVNQTRDRKQAIPTALLFKRAIPNIPTEAVLASLEKTQRLRTYVRTMSVQEDIWSDGDTRNVSRLAAIITDMSRLERVSLNHCIRPSHSVINALTSSPSLRVVVFKACSFSLQDIVNLLYSVPCLAVLHFEDMVSVNGLAEVHDESEEIVICPLIDFGDANTRLQNGVSLENRHQGVSLEELRFTRLEVKGIGECSALHLWDFLATSGVLREVGTLDVTAFDLYPVTPDRLQTMVNLTRRLFAIHGTDFCGDDRQGLKDKEPIHPVLQLNNISSYQFNISIDIHRPHYDTAAYVLDEKLLLWNIQALTTSHQLETLVIEFSLDSLYRPPNSNDGQTWVEVDKAVSTTARELRVLLLVFLASDRLEDMQKWMTAWILQRLPRTTTKFGLSEELGWHWNKGRRGCLKFLLR